MKTKHQPTTQISHIVKLIKENNTVNWFPFMSNNADSPVNQTEQKSVEPTVGIRTELQCTPLSPLILFKTGNISDKNTLSSKHFFSNYRQVVFATGTTHFTLSFWLFTHIIYIWQTLKKKAKFAITIIYYSVVQAVMLIWRLNTNFKARFLRKFFPGLFRLP